MEQVMRKFYLDTLYGCIAITLSMCAVTYISQHLNQQSDVQPVSIVVEDIPIIITADR